ncbi:MAG: GGDEF domain-containing protein [bacterium]|nr:GGDEF domain-containing protein [bacterium]
MNQSPLILACDHRGEGLSQTLRPLTSAGFRVETTTTLGQTRETLRGLRPDVVVIDPLAKGGLAELGELEQRQSENVPSVLVVADPGDPLPAILASRCLSDGPWDLVHRDAPLEEFLMRIERLRSLVREQSELDEMRYQAVHDDRTELLRPVPFQARLREHFSAAQRHRFDLGLVLIDLDRFGMVNKDFDHTTGDEVITRVGRVIRSTLRAEDVGGRLGGDEFAVVLPYTRRVDAARVVNRMRDQIQALTGPLDGGRGEVCISASIGFETFDGTDLESVETLRRHAEIALRQAKTMGGNRGLYYRSLEGTEGGAEPAADTPLPV